MNINNSEELDIAIIALEKRKVVQENNLRAAFQSTKESLRPMNLIKNTIQGITHTPEIRDSALKTAAGIGIGILTKNMFIGNAMPLIKNLVSNAVETGVQKSINKSSATVKAIGTVLISKLFQKKKKATTF